MASSTTAITSANPTATSATTATKPASSAGRKSIGSAGRPPSASPDRWARIPHPPFGGAPAPDPHRSPGAIRTARSRRWARRPLSRGRPGSARRPRPVAAGRRSGSAGTRSDPRFGIVRSRPTSPPARSPRVAFLPCRASSAPNATSRAARGARPRRSPAHPHHGTSGTCSQGRVGRRSRCRRSRATIRQPTIRSRSNDCVGPHGLSSAHRRRTAR